jgi:hypothetical protein
MFRILEPNRRFGKMPAGFIATAARTWSVGDGGDAGKFCDGVGGLGKTPRERQQVAYVAKSENAPGRSSRGFRA